MGGEVEILSITYLEWFTSDAQFPFFIHYGEHNQDVELHKHIGFSELVIVLNGNATHFVNTESSFIKKGDVFVINEETLHGYENPNDFNICNIMYRTEMLQSIGPDLRTSNGFQALFVLEPFYNNIRSFKSRLSLSITNLEYISSLISVMIEEYNGNLQGSRTMVISRFMELVVYLSRQYENQQNTDSNLMHMANAISYIEDHYLEPLTLEEIAAKSDISVRHLNRIFQTYYQTTPRAYQNRLRLERARTMLKMTRLPIMDISKQCGFPDSNYFTRQFTKAFGLSPRAYRLKR